MTDLGIGLVGHGWIARAHAHALRTVDRLAPLSRSVRLISLAGRRPDSVEAAAREFGFARWTTNWQDLLDDEEIDVIAIATPPESHAAIAIAAAEHGKHVLCEKPLAVDAEEARAMLETAETAGIVHASGFNYRFVPAVALIRKLVETGQLGDLRHYRALYLQDFAAAAEAGPREAGALFDYSHLIDMVRHLAGEPSSISARTSRFVSESEDAYVATLELRNGAVASLEASRIALGWKGRHTIELNGSRGSVWWDMEDLNHLHVFLADDEREGLGGFRNVLVTQPEHPYLESWWTPGHTLGWDASLVHQWRTFLEAVVEQRPADPTLASFADGHAAAAICDAIRTSSAENRTLRAGTPA
ncbi:MAG: Gfo/Idh/MocA family oxidoreductase [Gaiellaceae bacterium MAG52_C11]|nr:Gfo/Idh/MocA family oxidoreductase [Candidatus Gaiellasilicea maunaloa]